MCVHTAVGGKSAIITRDVWPPKGHIFSVQFAIMRASLYIYKAQLTELDQLTFNGYVKDYNNKTISVLNVVSLASSRALAWCS